MFFMHEVLKTDVRYGLLIRNMPYWLSVTKEIYAKLS